MNSFHHVQRRLDAAFVFERDEARYKVRHELSFACTLKMVQLMKVLALHTFHTREDVQREFATICAAMGIKAPHRVVPLDGYVVVACGASKALKGVAPEMCVDLCAWGALHGRAHSLTKDMRKDGKTIALAVRALEDVCAEVARGHGVDYVLINVLYENHYSSIASHPRNIDGLWKCHSVCHTIDGDAHKRVSFRDHPFELRHAPEMHYSGVVLWREPTVVMCCLTARAVDLRDAIAAHAAEVQMQLERLDEKDLLGYEYWMWRYVKRPVLRAEKKCCALM